MAVLSVESANGYAVCDDGKPLKTPAGADLVVPTKALAQGIVAEHVSLQGKKPAPQDIPLLQLAQTAIDIVTAARDKTIADITAYANSELLCHWAEQPVALVKQQEEIWQPLLDWFAESFNAPLKHDVGIMPIAQPQQSLDAIRRRLADYDVFRLAGLCQAVHAGGSLVLGMALATRHLNADEVSHAADIDAHQQMKDWGDDPAIRERMETARNELKHYERWFQLLDIEK